MSEADPDIAMLARLAALDLSAAEHVHGRLVATDEPAEIADLGRTYQRLSRCVRQTLALKARLAREPQVARAPALAMSPPSDPDLAARFDRVGELQNAVARIATAAEREDSFEDLFERLDIELDDWIDRPDFLTANVDDQVRAACRLLDLPEPLADAWRELPDPDEPPEAEPESETAAQTGAPEPPPGRWAGTWPDPPRESSG